MTAKRAKPKPVKMWATIGDDGFPWEAARSSLRAEYWRSIGERVVRVLITPIEPRKRGKK